jgi:uncharacterized protein (DUF362 family)
MKRFGNHPGIPRRDFLRLIGLMSSVAGFSAILQACEKAGLITGIDATSTPVQISPKSSPTFTAAPTYIAETKPSPTQPVTQETVPTSPTTAQTEVQNGVTQVAFVKTEDRAEGVRQAIEMLAPLPVADKEVFLKPNFNSADPAPGSTHPDTLRSLVLMLRELGASQIIVGDRSGMGDTRQVMQRVGLFDMAQELGFETMVLDELSEADWSMISFAGSHWERGFPFPNKCLECGALVQTCCLKTHRYGGHFTMSLKNSVGMVAKRVPGDSYNYMSELHGSPDQRVMIAEINSAYQPALVVMDGIEAFVNGGPDQGKRVHPGIILAGTDRIAIDAIGVAILRYFGTTREVADGPIFQLEQIARSVELGIGVSSPNQIQILTPDGASEAFAGEIKDVLLRD